MLYIICRSCSLETPRALLFGESRLGRRSQVASCAGAAGERLSGSVIALISFAPAARSSVLRRSLCHGFLTLWIGYLRSALVRLRRPSLGARDSRCRRAAPVASARAGFRCRGRCCGPRPPRRRSRRPARRRPPGSPSGGRGRRPRSRAPAPPRGSCCGPAGPLSTCLKPSSCSPSPSSCANSSGCTHRSAGCGGAEGRRYWPSVRTSQPPPAGRAWRWISSSVSPIPRMIPLFVSWPGSIRLPREQRVDRQYFASGRTVRYSRSMLSILWSGSSGRASTTRRSAS